jgi:hypothetical protein
MVQTTIFLSLDSASASSALLLPSLRGEVAETYLGDLAVKQRRRLRSARIDVDVIKPVESRLTNSLADFEITKATVSNRSSLERPLEWRYTLAARAYAKTAGDLLLLRPRVIGVYRDSFLEESEKPRQFPIEFDVPGLYTDVFEIGIPDGYVVQEIPAHVERDLGFISYRSKTEVVGGTVRYTRTYEIREVSVPAAQASALKQLYRDIEADERMSAVLALAASH